MITDAIEYMLRNKADFPAKPEHLKELAQAYAMSVRKQILEVREHGDHQPQILAPSRATKCVRQSFYKRVGLLGEPPAPRRNLTFWWGDLTEASLRFLAQISGVAIAGSERKLTIPVGSGEVTGYVDDIAQGKNSGKRFLIEYKSMTGFTFKSFRDAGEKGLPVPDAFGYSGQVQMYIRGGLEAGIIDPPGWCLIMTFNKDTGHIYERFVKYEPKVAEVADRNYELIKKAEETGTPPPRLIHDGVGGHTELVPYKKARAKKGSLPELPLQCGYCDYRWSCWEGRDPESFELDGDSYLPVFKEGDKGNGDRVELNFSHDRFGSAKPVWNYRAVEV